MDQLIFSQEGWPLVQESVLFIEQMFKKPIEALGQSVGDNVIIFGVEENNGAVSPGYVVHNGELLPFIAGNLGENVVIVEETTEANYDTNNDGNFTNLAPVWKKRYAKFGLAGTGVEDIPFADFERIEALKDLKYRPDFLHQGKININFSDPTLYDGTYTDIEDVSPNYSFNNAKHYKIHFPEIIGDYYPLIYSRMGQFNKVEAIEVGIVERASNYITIALMNSDTSNSDPSSIEMTHRIEMYLIGKKY